MAVELCRVVAEVVAHAPTPGPSNSTTSNIAIPSSSRRLLLAATFHSITLHAHDIYTYNVQTTRNPPVFSGTRSSTRTRTRTPSSFRCVASIEIERSPSPSQITRSTISRNLKRNGKPFFFPPISFEISSPTSMHIYIYKLIGDGRTRVTTIRVAANAGSVGSLDVPRSCGSQLLHAGKELLLLPLLVSCVYMYPLR